MKARAGICGPVGDEDIAIINRYFVDILIGEDPHAIERIWDKMYRRSIHGRKGTPMLALSKVDLALWDLKGKLLNAPVASIARRAEPGAYPRLRVHAGLTRSSRIKSSKGRGTSWRRASPPSSGSCLARPKTASPASGGTWRSYARRGKRPAPIVDLMFDAWSSWNVPYTLRMIELSREYRPYWFEEPVLADLIPQYAELRQEARGVFISGGEHEYTRWGVKALLDARAVDILQADVTWAGGIKRDDENLRAWHRLMTSR